MAVAPPRIPLTDQLTDVFVELATTAVSCSVPPKGTFALVGDTVTVTSGGGGGGWTGPATPVHPVTKERISPIATAQMQVTTPAISPRLVANGKSLFTTSSPRAKVGPLRCEQEFVEPEKLIEILNPGVSPQLFQNKAFIGARAKPVTEVAFKKARSEICSRLSGSELRFYASRAVPNWNSADFRPN